MFPTDVVCNNWPYVQLDADFLTLVVWWLMKSPFLFFLD